MSLGEKWTIRNIREEDPSYYRGDKVYQDGTMNVAFSFDPARRKADLDRVENPQGLPVFVTSLHTMRYINSEKAVPENIGFQIADRIGAYCWEKGWLFYTIDHAGWHDDHAGNRWPGFASMFPTVRHALNWSFTDTRWGQNHHDPYVDYCDERGTIRLSRYVGYGPIKDKYGARNITCVLFVHFDFREDLVTDARAVDDAWFERVKDRIEQAYMFEYTSVTFVQIEELV